MGLPRILSERLTSPSCPGRQSSCHMADEFRGKGTSYCIMSFFHHFSREILPGCFSCYTCMCVLPQFPDPPAHSCQADLPQTPGPLLCREALRACVSPGNGARPLPSRTIALPAGPPCQPGCSPTSSLLSIMRSPLLESPCLSSIQTVLPWQGASSVTFPAKVAHRGLPRVPVGHSLVLVVICSHIGLSSPGKLLFPSKKRARDLFSQRVPQGAWHTVADTQM